MRCKLCKKKQGDHKSETYHCPIGGKTRIGSLQYSPDKTFVPSRLILKINIHDNDYGATVEDACKIIVERISGLEQYIRIRKKHSLEELKYYIIECACGVHLCHNMAGRIAVLSFCEVSQEKTDDLHKVRAYLTRIIELSEEDSIIKKWENGEVVYVDFDKRRVVRQ